jgi:ribose/xylose/arabinose/galactoside ABC-type transport system permease subunit
MGVSLFLTGRTGYNLIPVIVQMREFPPTTFDIVGNTFAFFIPAVVVTICQIALLLMIMPVFRSFGWKVYRKVGASPQLISKFNPSNLIPI